MSETTTQILTINVTDAQSLMAAIKAGITTPELLSEWIDGAELIEDALVLKPGQTALCRGYRGQRDGRAHFDDPIFWDSRDPPAFTGRKGRRARLVRGDVPAELVSA